jgi:hypothetical protein
VGPSRSFCLSVLFFAISHSASAQLPSLGWANANNTVGGTDEVNGLVVDDSGNTFATGCYGGDVDFDPGPSTYQMTGGYGTRFFVAKYLPGGAVDWVFDASSTSSSTYATGLSIVMDSSGFIYVAGKLYGGPMDFDPGNSSATLLSSAGGYDLFVAKYNCNVRPTDPGFFQWAFCAGGSGDQEANSIDVDSSGNVVITGIFEGSNIDFNPSSSTTALSSAGFDDIFLAKYNGNLLPSQNSFFCWAFRIGGSSYETAAGVRTMDDGTIFFGGGVTTTVDFDPSANSNTFISAGGTDFCLASYNGNLLPSSTSFCRWAFGVGGANVDEAVAMDLDQSGFLYVTGVNSGNLDFDPSANTHLSPIGSAACVLKYDVNPAAFRYAVLPLGIRA